MIVIAASTPTLKTGWVASRRLLKPDTLLHLTVYPHYYQFVTLGLRVSVLSYLDNVEQWTDHSDRNKCGKSHETSQVCQLDHPEHPMFRSKLAKMEACEMLNY